MNAHAGNRLIGIQFGRGIAALLVVFYHATRSLALPQYLGQEPLGNFFGFGHAGVDFFFVLSGFIISFVHHDDIGRPARLPRFLWRRLTRIFPIYWVILSVVIVQALLSTEAASRLQVGNLLRGALLLPFPADLLIGVAWSLEQELLFYACFALAIAWRPMGLIMTALGVALMLWSTSLPEQTHWTGYFCTWFHLEFLLGILAAKLVRSDAVRMPRTLAAVGVGLFIGSGLCENAGLFGVGANIGNCLYGLASTLIVVGLAGAERSGRLALGNWAELFGGASYALYLIHPLVVGIGARMLSKLGWLAFMPPWILMLTLAAASMVVAIALHRLVEQPMLARARLLERHLGFERRSSLTPNG